MIKWREPVQKKLFSLTHPQKRIWYTEQLNPETGLYNIGGFIRIKGNIDLAVIEQAFVKLYERNDALRLTIVEDDGEYKQYLRDVEEYSLRYYDFSKEQNPMQIAYQWMEKETAKLFPEGELCENVMLKLADDDFIWYAKCHHTISDGWTCALLVRDLDNCYQQVLTGIESDQPTPPSYLEYIEDEKKYKSSKRFQKNRDFWLENMQNVPQAVTLSLKRQISRTMKGKRYSIFIEQSTTDHIKNFVTQSGTSVYIFFMTVLFTYMYRMTGEKDMVIGTPVLNRSSSRQKKTIGMFVSTMPFRVNIDDELTFAEFQKMILQNQKRYYRNQQYPMDLLIKDLQLAQKGNNKLFDISLSYQNSSTKELFNGSPIEFNWVFNGSEENSLTIHINEWMNQGTLRIDFDYAVDVFGQEDIEQLARRFINITKQVLNESDLPLDQIEYMDQEEKDMLLSRNNIQVDYPKEKTITQLFEEQVERTPDKIAVVFEGQKLTYRELNEKANQLARVLRAKGVSRDQVVGLMVDKSLKMMIGVLAIIKAGGAYLPIDIDYPDNRIEYMLNDSQARILLTHQNTIPGIDFNGEIINLSNPQYDNQDVTNLEQINQAHDLIYIIYTSGSTGKPKGVMIEHRNVVRLLFNDKFQFDFSEKDTWTMFHSYCFDFSVWEMYGPLLYGGRLIVIPKMVARDPEKFLEILKQEQVTVLNQTPSAFYNLINAELAEQDHRLQIRYVIFGGEALNPIKLKDWKEKYPTTQLINMYGITETTVHVTFKEITDHEIEHNISNIGKPIPTLTTYVMDANLKLLPIGVPGELCVGGDGVARGYLNRPELTEIKFLPNPYRPEERIYRSGDLVQMLTNGEMEYLGRIDHQVKIRGFRIELGEIESKLLNHPKIKEAIVMARENEDGDKYLCAYFMADQQTAVVELRKYLSKDLPDYMIPAYFIQLEEIPLTRNGKVNRKALPEPDHEINHGEEYVAPRNDVEEVLVQIWQEVLGVKQVGINDNFFALGGDSIKAIQISSRLQRYNLKLEVQKLFQNPNIADLSDYVQLVTKETDQSTVEGEVNLTPIQNWFFAKNLTDQHHFNQSVILFNEKGFKEDWIAQVFLKIVEHHDALRMIYQTEGSKIQQINQGIKENLFDLYVYNFRNEDNYELLIDEEAHKLQGSINLTAGPLVKLGLFQTKAGDYLLIAIHHLVIDGVSWRILFEDFATGYQQLEKGEEIRFPLKTTSYQKWAEQLISYANSEELLHEMGYWRQLEEVEPISLPYDHQINADQKKDSGLVAVSLSSEETELLLKEVHRAYNTEINDILLAALAVTLREWSQEEKILINLEGHGREEIIEDVDVNRTIGWFTSIYPVLIDLPNTADPGEMIKRTKERLRAIPNKGVGYGILKYLTSDKYKKEMKLTLHPEVSFNYLGQFDQEVNADIFSIANIAKGHDMSLSGERFHTLDIVGIIKDDRLVVNVDYNQKEFETSTITGLMNSFIDHLRQMIAHCLAKEETELTLSDFSDHKLDEEELEDIFSDLEELFEV